MRRAVRGSLVALVPVLGLVGVTGCGASHTATTVVNAANAADRTATTAAATPILAGPWADRKSTRLNSSHANISALPLPAPLPIGRRREPHSDDRGQRRERR